MIPRFSGIERKEKRQIGVVGVEEIEVAKIESVVAGNGREEGIQKVATLVVQLGIMNAKDLVKLGGRPLDRSEVVVIDNDGQ